MDEPYIIDCKNSFGKPKVFKGMSPTILGTHYKEPPLVLGDYKSTYQDTYIKEESNGMKVNSFFCGAGGFDLGFIQAGWEVAGAWDFDKYAIQSYKHNIGEAEQADVTKLTGTDIPKANGWLFGFPCQDISVAGKSDKTGKTLKEKPRSGLFYQIMRLLGEVEEQPEWILAENVKNVRKLIPEIEEEYDRAGYVLVQPQLYNTKFWFLPQNRERYFLFGVRKDLTADFVFPEQQTEYVPKLVSILEDNVDEKYYMSDDKAKVIIDRVMEGLKVKQATKQGYTIATEGDSINISHPDSKTRRGRVGKQVAQTLLTGQEQVVVEPVQDSFTDKDGAAYCIDANYHKGVGPSAVGKAKRTQVVEPHLKQIGLLDMKGNECVRRVYDPEGISPTLTTMEGGHRQPKIIASRGRYNEEGNVEQNYESRNDGVTNTITSVQKDNLLITGGVYNQNDGFQPREVGCTLDASYYKGLGNNQNRNAVMETYRIRKLTPRECARLQGFPDSYEQIVSDTQFYKQMGNAVSVTVSYTIAKAIKEWSEKSEY